MSERRAHDASEAPTGAPPRSRPPAATPGDDGAVIGLGIASVVFLFGIFVVLVLAGAADSARALAFLAIPLTGLAVSGLLFVLALRERDRASRSAD